MNVKTKILGAITAPIAGLALLAMTVDPGPAAAASHAPAQSGGQGMTWRGTMGPGMMGQGMMGGGMMGGGQGMMGGGQGMMRRGMMSGGMMGRMMNMMRGMSQGMMSQGMRVTPGLNISAKDVRRFLEFRLERIGNKRLKVGEVKATDDRTIIADIVTVDKSLVWRFKVDRYSGWMREAN